MSLDEYGKLTVTRHTHIRALDSFETFSAKWEGPARILVSDEFLEQAEPALIQRDGDTFSVCQFRLRLVGRYDSQTHIAERIDA